MGASVNRSIQGLGQLIQFRGVFTPLRDESEFAKVRVDPNLGTIAVGLRIPLIMIAQSGDCDHAFDRS